MTTDTNTAGMVVDLRASDDAVRAKGWVSPGLGVPGAPLGMLSATLNPLGGLAAAGLGWFLPMVSFLGEPLTQLQGGNGASITSGSQHFDAAGQEIGGVADSYRASAAAQTADWSGTAATEYRDAATQHADGVAGLGQASNTVGSAIIGAGQVVAQAIAEVTELIAEAVAQIVPIMTQAVARAGETFGQSVVEAIPPCVGIAVEYALRIAAKLAALVASGQNLLKLVQGAMAVVDLIKQAMSGISQQSTRPDLEPTTAASGSGEAQGGTPVSALAAGEPANTEGAAVRGDTGASAQAASAGGSGGGSAGGGFSAGGAFSPGGSSTPVGSARLDVAPQSYVPPVNTPLPDAARMTGPTGGGSTAVPGGALPIGAAGAAHGDRVGAGRGVGRGGEHGTGRGADTAGRQEAGQQPPRTAGGSAQGGVPMGGMGAAQTAGEKDKEHQRKYAVVALHNETVEVAPSVIDGETRKA
jgi:hypothetical protein